jgi:hydroxymethylbilane synthase
LAVRKDLVGRVRGNAVVPGYVLEFLLAQYCATDDEATIDAAATVNDIDAMRELTAERTVVALLDATCASPLGAHARIAGGRLAIEAFVGLPDGSEWLRDRIEASAEEPALAGAELVQRLLGAGARELLDRAEEMV